MFEEAKETEDREVLREGLGQRLLNKDVLYLVGVWLALFWSGFGIGFLVGRS